MDNNIKEIYKVVLGNNGYGAHNKSSPIDTVMFPDGDIIFRYDCGSTGLPPNWVTLYLRKIISKEDLKKRYPARDPDFLMEYMKIVK